MGEIIYLLFMMGILLIIEGYRKVQYDHVNDLILKTLISILYPFVK